MKQSGPPKSGGIVKASWPLSVPADLLLQSFLEGLHCQERGHDCLTDLATVNPDEFNRTLFKVPSATSQTPLMMADEAGTPPGSPVAPLAPPSDDATLEAASGDHSSRKGDRGPKNDGEGHPLLPRSRTSPVEDDGGSRLEASHICTNPYLTAENVRKPVPSPNNCPEETQAIQIVLSGSSGSGSLRNNGSSSMSGKGHTRGHQKGPSPSTSNGGSATRFGCTWSSLCGRNPKKVTTMLAAFTSVWVLYVIMLHFKKEVRNRLQLKVAGSLSAWHDFDLSYWREHYSVVTYFGSVLV